MKRSLPFLLLLLAASAFAYAPSPKVVSPGAHQLVVSAKHPSGQFTTNAGVWFTNSASGGDRVEDFYNSAGLVRRRIWRDASGATNRTQYFYWDSKERLYMFDDYDSQYNGYVWMADYDGLDRRLRTRTYPTVNGVTYISGVTPKTIHQYYDPLAEFLELGVTVDNATTWKICGPDAKLEAVAPGLNVFNPTLTDIRGNVLGAVTNGIAINWTGARPTGYGAASSYRPLPLGNGGDLVQSAAWHGVWSDITGLYWRGKRYYDPESGRWMTADPAWNEGDPNYYSYCGGDPINFDDPNGMLASKFFNQNPAGVFIGGSANEAANMAGRFIDGSVEATALGGDMMGQSAASVFGYGADYQGNSELYQNIYNNPVNGPTASGILADTGGAVANVGTLGLYGMVQGFSEGLATGDFSHAQDASLNSLLLGTAMRTPTVPAPSPNPVQMLQNLTEQANSRLAANPSLARSVLYSAEITAAQTRPFLNPMAYGNAIERLVRQEIQASPQYQSLFRPLGGANNPDFVGVGPATGMNFDITTPAQAARHLSRPLYGEGLNVITYQRPQGWTVPPTP